MDYFRTSIKVALLFIVSCLILTYFVLHAGQVRMVGATQDFKLLFSSVGNLKLDSPVTYSGFKVGQVIEIRPLSQEERREHSRDIEVRVRLNKDVEIREDSKARIQSLGFLGEKYIEISPGGLEALPLDPGKSIYGDVPPDISTAVDHFSKQFDEMLPTVKNTLEKLNSSVERIDLVIQEVANEKKIQKLLDAMDQITKKLDQVIAENRENIKDALKNTKDLTQGAKDITVSLQQELDEAFPRVQRILIRMNLLLDDMDQLLIRSRKLIGSHEPEIESIIKNLEEASVHAKEFLKILKEQPWRLLAKPRQPPPQIQGPRRGYVIRHSDVPEKKKRK